MPHESILLISCHSSFPPYCLGKQIKSQHVVVSGSPGRAVGRRCCLPQGGRGAAKGWGQGLGVAGRAGGWQRSWGSLFLALQHPSSPAQSWDNAAAGAVLYAGGKPQQPQGMFSAPKKDPAVCCVWDQSSTPKRDPADRCVRDQRALLLQGLSVV